MLPVLAAIGLFQWWQLGGPTAARIVLNVLVCIVAASILTATTPVQRLLDGVASLARPFQRFGADPERFALTIAIMLRSIPFIAGAYSDVRDSARARGLERNPRALILPVFITTVAFARQTGDALAARGLGEAEDRGACTARRPRRGTCPPLTRGHWTCPPYPRTLSPVFQCTRPGMSMSPGGVVRVRAPKPSTTGHALPWRGALDISPVCPLAGPRTEHVPRWRGAGLSSEAAGTTGHALPWPGDWT